jgi:thiol-disulfide isomerase/thioredoxin
MFRFWLLAALLAIASSVTLFAVKMNSPAPEIALDRLIPDQPVENATLRALAGKSVVVEFWATWCAPCVAQIPHLNKLASNFKNRPIQFLSITQEKPDVVNRFLRQHPIEGWVGMTLPKRGPVQVEEVFDGESIRERMPPDAFKAYGVVGIPKTVLIDSNGKVVAITFPSSVDASVLENLMAGRPVHVPAIPPIRGIVHYPPPLY